MATSQNGWKAGSAADVGLTTVVVPGTTTKLPVKSGDVATVLLWVATRWHHDVEPLVEPGNWGYADRNVRGSVTDVSNHASGTAIDLNAPKHPLGTAPAKTMSKTQITAAQRIEADSGGVVRWGGSYTGRTDPMHWEINASPARVAAFAASLRGTPSPPASTGTTGGAQPGIPAKITEEDDDMDNVLIIGVKDDDPAWDGYWAVNLVSFRAAHLYPAQLALYAGVPAGRRHEGQGKDILGRFEHVAVTT